MPLPSLGGLTNAYKALPGSAQRTLLHTGMGAAGGAVLGGLTAQEGQRLRGAATGGVIGGAAAGGASYLANRSAGAAIKGLRGQNAGLSDQLSKAEGSLASLGGQHAELMGQHANLQDGFNSAQTAYNNLQQNYQNARNEISAARAVINGGMVDPASRSFGNQFGTPGSAVGRNINPGDGIGRFNQQRALPLTNAHGDTVPNLMLPTAQQPVIPSPAGPAKTQVNPVAPLHRNNTLAGPMPVTQQSPTFSLPMPASQPAPAQSGMFPVQGQWKVSSAFPLVLDPTQGAMLGGLGGAAVGGGLAALDPETRNARTILRNAGIGGATGALGGYGLTAAGAAGGYSAGHHRGRIEGFQSGVEEAAAQQFLRAMGRFD